MKKKTLHFVLTRVFNTPLMIHPQKLQVIESVLRSRMPANVFFDNDDDEPAPEEIDTGSHSADSVEGMTNVAVIPVYGSLVQRNVNISDCFTSYVDLERQLKQAVDSPQVEAILLDIDSCGGEANGCFELVDRIFEAREVKPVYALVNEQAFSGGYAIASAANKIWAPKTGNVGSIGVIMTHFDYSKMAEEDGVAITHIIAGKKKADGSPYKPLSPSALKDFQSEVDKLYDVFVNAVARNRGLSTQAVRGTEAGTYMGRSALKAGLVDEVISLADLPAKLTEAIMKKTTVAGASATATPNKPAAAGEAPAPGEDLNTGPDDESEDEDEGAEVEVTADDDEEEEEEDPTPPGKKKKVAASQAKDQVNAAREAAAEITRMCTVMGQPALAAKFISKGLSVGQAKIELFDMAAKGEAVIINAVAAEAEANEGTPLLVNAMKKLNEDRSKAR